MIFAILNAIFTILIVGSDKMKQKLFIDLAENNHQENILIEQRKTKGVIINHYLIDEESCKELKKVEGEYYSINFNEEILSLKKNVVLKETTKALKKILGLYNTKKTLIIGLGNSDIEADSIGVKTTNKIIATNHYNDFLTIPKVALFNPEVTEKTGINSFNLIKLVVNDLKPDCIIIIDSLATKNDRYLNKCIEINNTGIIPGSAIRSNREINKKTFNIPVITIGVPLVLELKDKLYTTPDVKLIIDLISDIISASLNNIFLS